MAGRKPQPGEPSVGSRKNLSRSKHAPATTTPSPIIEWADLRVQRVEYEVKTRIFAQGDQAASVMYVERGTVRLSVLSHAGKEAVIAVLEAGHFFGEGCLVGQTQRMATALAMLSQYATPGAMNHNSRNGTAEGKLSRCVADTTNVRTPAMIGLAIMPPTNRSSARPPRIPAARAAVAAAVSHSSRRRRVTVRRTNVKTIAWRVCHAWYARNVTLRKTCASVTAVSARRFLQNTGNDCARRGPTSICATSGRSCDAITVSTDAVQNQ